MIYDWTQDIVFVCLVSESLPRKAVRRSRLCYLHAQEYSSEESIQFCTFNHIGLLWRIQWHRRHNIGLPEQSNNQVLLFRETCFQPRSISVVEFDRFKVCGARVLFSVSKRDARTNVVIPAIATAKKRHCSCSHRHRMVLQVRIAPPGWPSVRPIPVVELRMDMRSPRWSEKLCDSGFGDWTKIAVANPW